MNCKWCDEVLTWVDYPPGEPAYMHYECGARSVLGSVGHLKGNCTCYGGTEEDPPGMTRRQAAWVAWTTWLERSQGKQP